MDPDLPVGTSKAGEAPSRYDLLPPSARGAYLAWLAGGRQGTRVPIAFVWLFLFGVERRVLVDRHHDPSTWADLPTILAETRRLAGTHTRDPRLARAAQSLADLVELLTASGSTLGREEAPPPASPRTGGGREGAPMGLRLGLARLALARAPLPPAWAASWAWYHPDLPPLTAQQRCRSEFDRLFALWYSRDPDPGLVPAATGCPVRERYLPANPTLSETTVERPDLPEVLGDPHAAQRLAGLREEVAEALEPHSRWLAGHPGCEATLAAVALLPPELVEADRGLPGRLRAWAEAVLRGRARAVVHLDDLRERGFLPRADPGTDREASAGLALALALAGIGIEPDARFCGPALSAGPAVLFRLPEPESPPGATWPESGLRRDYSSLATAIDLAAGLVAASGWGKPWEAPSSCRLIEEIAVGAMTVSPVSVVEDPAEVEAELTRLAARLVWRLESGVPARPVARRASVLASGTREATGRFLTTVVVGLVGSSPPVRTALAAARRLLALGSEPPCPQPRDPRASRAGWYAARETG